MWRSASKRSIASRVVKVVSQVSHLVARPGPCQADSDRNWFVIPGTAPDPFLSRSLSTELSQDLVVASIAKNVSFRPLANRNRRAAVLGRGHAIWAKHRRHRIKLLGEVGRAQNVIQRFLVIDRQQPPGDLTGKAIPIQILGADPRRFASGSGQLGSLSQVQQKVIPDERAARNSPRAARLDERVIQFGIAQ